MAIRRLPRAARGEAELQAPSISVSGEQASANTRERDRVGEVSVCLWLVGPGEMPRFGRVCGGCLTCSLYVTPITPPNNIFFRMSISLLSFTCMDVNNNSWSM